MKPPKPTELPRHIAIVMDGNRRWARAHFLPSLEGHRRGVKAVRRTIEACIDFKIPIVTLYTFSSENWNRSKEEVSALMGLLALHLRREMDELVSEGVRFKALGRITQLPDNIQALVADLEEQTKDNDKLLFNIALNYGGRQELVDASRQLAQKALDGELKPEDIDEDMLSKHLTTRGIDDPDLWIRTGGDQRVSNFLLWQLAYSEMVFLPIYWPEFNATHLQEAIDEFGTRERRFGASK
ncbi:MAG: di-trans,poly-cis-decaprenylcistransferase [Magnetococcales bacterium]|nr:di-trans,poly-cis-decaprenylcistransferase [Magnetococcales bacterium]